MVVSQTLDGIQYTQNQPGRFHFANSITFQTIYKFTERRIRTNKAVNVHTLTKFTYSQPNRTVSFHTLGEIARENVFGDCKIVWNHSLSNLLYAQQMQVKTYQALSNILFETPSGDTKIKQLTTTTQILNRVVPGDTKLKTVLSLGKIKHPRETPPKHYQTVDKIQHKPVDNHIVYQTVSKISHKPCTDVRCDNTTMTWQEDCIDTTYHNDAFPRATYGVTKIRVIMFSNDTEEFMKPEGYRMIRVSDIRLKYRNNQVYNLTSFNVSASNCGQCFLGDDINSIDQLFSSRLQTTTDQLTSGRDAGVVLGTHMAVCFTLTGCEPITHVEIAPGGDDYEPRNTPGMVRVDCMSPGVNGWYTVAAYRTERKAINGYSKHNQGSNMWKLGEYRSFPLLINTELYRINNEVQSKICA